MTLHLVIMEKKRNSKFWWGCGRKGNPCALLVEIKIGAYLCKTVWKVLKKLKLSYDPAIPLYEYLAEDNENTNSKTYMHPHVHCITIHNSQDMGVTWVSIAVWMNNEYIQTEYYPVIKREWKRRKKKQAYRRFTDQLGGCQSTVGI